MQEFQYSAFISYKHGDKAWARWLQRQLERYRLPSKLCKQYDLPRKLNAVFRDETDAAAGVLKDELHQGLSQSKFLIVVCSKKLAKSAKYVDFEVEAFKERRGFEYIVPFIIDGEPHAKNPDEECFPPSLTTLPEDVLGANAYLDGKRDALLRVVARILSVRFDELKQREQRRTRIRTAWLAAACALALCAGAFALDYSLPKTRLYADYTLRFGVPVGIGDITREDARVMTAHYVIVERERKVRELRHENALGALTTHEDAEAADRPARAVYEYTPAGALDRASYYDAAGKRVLTMDYSDDLTVVNLVASTDRMRPYVMAASTAGARASLYEMADFEQKSAIVRHLLTYDENGFLIETRYARDLFDTPVADADGVYGLAYTRDALGRVTSVRSLTEAGDAASVKEYEYDGYQIASVTRSYAGGFLRMTREHDARGNLTGARYADAAGAPALCEDGYARMAAAYDENGCQTSAAYFDASGAPAPCSAGYARVTREYDALGRVASERYFDASGAPVASVSGYAVQRTEYDALGRVIYESYLDAQGAPATLEGGYAAVAVTYNEQGLVASERYFDAQGAPAWMLGAYAGITLAYNDKGLLTRAEYVGADGAPATHPDGYAGEAWQYDPRGNVALWTFLSADGAPIDTKDGYASIALTHDDGGALTRLAYFAADGAPATLAEGYAAEEMTRDARGNITRWEYFGADGAPVMTTGGYARIDSAFDAEGRLSSVAYYDADGALQDRFAYGASGYLYEHEKPGEQGERVTYRYSEQGSILAHRTEDAQGAATTMYFDETGAVTIYETEDAQGGVVRLRLNASRDVLWRETFDPQTRVARRTTYDEQGRMALIETFDEHGAPVAGENGYAGRARTYDAAGNVASETYLDTRGARMRGANGYAEIRLYYNENGSVAREEYYDENGDPVCCFDGYASAEMDYDEQGEVAAFRMYDEDGREIK